MRRGEKTTLHTSASWNGSFLHSGVAERTLSVGGSFTGGGPPRFRGRVSTTLNRPAIYTHNNQKTEITITFQFPYLIWQ